MTTPATCSLCLRPGATLQAGGDVGLCHQTCFDALDQASEAAERSLVALLATLPPTPTRRSTRRAA